MDTKQYIGEKEIQEVSWNIVKFIDWTEETFTDTQLEYVITDEQKDYTAFEDIVVKAITDDVHKVLGEVDIYDPVKCAWKILEVYEDHNIKMNEVDAIWFNVLSLVKEIMQVVADSYMAGYKIAVW
jgi:hypothetical protein